MSTATTTFPQPVRTRSHRGNIPKLPQTKFCTFCPAKFTRTTHLNRHVRSHINQRLYRCDMCNSEFTRSDLLSRHKKTCGNSQHSHRSRQKSCQACADSKIKCDLVYPCSKCTSRGRVCVFVNDPEVSRMKRLASKSNRSSTKDDSESPRASSVSSQSTPPPSFTSAHLGSADSSCSMSDFDQMEPPWHFGSESEATDYETGTPSPPSSFHELYYADSPAATIRSPSMIVPDSSSYIQPDYPDCAVIEGPFNGNVPPKVNYYETFDSPGCFSPYTPSFIPQSSPAQHGLPFDFGTSNGTFRYPSGRPVSATASNSIPQGAGPLPYSNFKSWFPDDSLQSPCPPVGGVRSYQCKY